MKLKITIDEKTYEVDVEAVDPEARAAAPRDYVAQPAPVRVTAGAPAPPPSQVQQVANEDKVCRSPVAGVVVRLVAQSGQTIQSGDLLLVLEAMKMETNITSPIAGKVSKVNVQPGDAVQVGQVVVEFE